MPKSFIKVSEDSQPHSEWSFVTTYVRSENVLQIPTAGPPGSASNATEAKIVRLAAPSSKKIVSWTAHRIGALPELPPPEPVDENEILLSWEISPAIPLVNDGVVHSYVISGTYVYILKKPCSVDTGLPMGSSAVDDTPSKSSILGRGNFTAKPF